MTTEPTIARTSEDRTPKESDAELASVTAGVQATIDLCNRPADRPPRR